MNRNYLLKMAFLLCTIGVVPTACSSDDDSPNEPDMQQTDPRTLELNITEGGSTTTSYTFNIKASDADIAYLCLYVDQAAFEGISKARLVENLLRSLKKQAETKQQDFETYLQGIAIKGDYEAKIENLTPGGVYELVAFPLLGTQAVGKIETAYFQTPYVNLQDCTFDVSGSWTDKGYALSVKPSKKDVPYYIAATMKSNYDEYIKQYSNEDLLKAYLAQSIKNNQQQTGQDVATVFNGLVKVGDRTAIFSSLNPGDQLVWLIGGVALVNDNTEISLTTAVAVGNVTIPQKTVGANAMLQRPETGYVPLDVWTATEEIPLVRSVK